MSTPDALATQPGRGRGADNPTEIPMRGWKDVLWRIYADITENHILLTAAGVTFYMLLSLVPTLNAVISIYGLFNDRQSVLQHVELLAGIVPPDALSIVREQLTRLTGESNDALGVTLLVSLAIALWSASAGVKAMFEAMNVAYHEQEERSFIVLNAVALLFTFCGAVAVVLVLAVVVLMPFLVQAFLPGGGLEWAVRIGSYAVMLVVLSLMLAVLYRWGPSRQQAKWRWITPGVALSVVALGLGSVGFSWYVANFTDQNATYGSLSAVIGLMTWLWISTTLVIVGAVLNSEIEHQTAKDSTTGEEQPLGNRGAFVADSVGEAAGASDEEKDRAPRRDRKPISWATLAFALPAALALSAANRRGRRE